MDLSSLEYFMLLMLTKILVCPITKNLLVPNTYVVWIAVS